MIKPNIDFPMIFEAWRRSTNTDYRHAIAELFMAYSYAIDEGSFLSEQCNDLEHTNMRLRAELTKATAATTASNKPRKRRTKVKKS